MSAAKAGGGGRTTLAACAGRALSRIAPAIGALALAWSATASASVVRSFVATNGSDSNTAANCAPTTPCRTFTAALGVTAAGGEVIALNSGGYGPFTVTQSATIVAPPGVYAGIVVASGAGVTVNGAGITVTLRGLTINGTGGSSGIAYVNGLALNVENLTISNFSGSGGAGILATAIQRTGAGAVNASLRVIDSVVLDCLNGIDVQDGPNVSVVRTRFLGTLAGSARSMATGLLYTVATESDTQLVTVVDSVVNDGVGTAFSVQNGGSGAIVMAIDRTVVRGGSVGVSATGAGKTTLTISNCVLAGLGTAVLSQSAGAGPGPAVYLNNDQVFDDTTGVQAAAGGAVDSFGNNAFGKNGADGTATALPLE